MKDVDIQAKSYAEEAEWWDATDTGEPEYADEFQPVNARFSQKLSQSMQVRFDPATDQALEERARELGVKKSTLVRIWVKERLRQDQERHAS